MLLSIFLTSVMVSLICLFLGPDTLLCLHAYLTLITLSPVSRESLFPPTHHYGFYAEHWASRYTTPTRTVPETS